MHGKRAHNLRQMIRLFFITIPLFGFALVLSSCSAVGIATGLGATAGVAAVQEGGIKRAVSDVKIQAAINDLWFSYSIEAFTKLDMTVNQGRVLLTGVVQNPEHRVEAVRLAWQPEGVDQVINEIRVAESAGIVGFARDSWISARLRTAITFDKDVQSVNYNIDTVQGTVYLIGVAQSQSELNRVVETARTVPDVRRVVTYVKIAGPLNSGKSDKSAGSMDAQHNDSISKDNHDTYVVRNPTETSSPITSSRNVDEIDSDSAPLRLTPIDSETLN